MYRGGGGGRIFFKKIEKKFRLALFNPVGRWAGNNFLFKFFFIKVVSSGKGLHLVSHNFLFKGGLTLSQGAHAGLKSP